MSIYTRVSGILIDRDGWKPMMMLMWIAELILTIAVVWFVPYTEIDWKAYMQEVAGPIEQNDWDYMNLRGDTGPLVYPGGFVYIYAILYWLTDFGQNIKTAQWLFVGFYMIFVTCVYAIYYKVANSGMKIPPWILLFVSGSRRIHSIFVLRLFNDGLAMLLLYASLLLFTNRRWKWGCLVFSLAVSIKMNVLLFAPALLFLMFKAHGILGSISLLTICAIPQILVAIPFLKANFWGYINRAFEFSRVFTYKWTVNWKFVSEEFFISKQLALMLLGMQLAVTAYFVWRRWFRHEGWRVVRWGRDMAVVLNPAHFIVLMFEANYIGMVFSRSIHYQFYVWYHATLPLLLWQTRLPVPFRVLLMVAIEICYNVYPSTAWSSLLLQSSHALLLIALAISIVPHPKVKKG